jgi:hypothetical protein
VQNVAIVDADRQIILGRRVAPAAACLKHVQDAAQDAAVVHSRPTTDADQRKTLLRISVWASPPKRRNQCEIEPF